MPRAPLCFLPRRWGEGQRDPRESVRSTPRTKRKRPWGAGVFRSRLGVVGSSTYPRGDFGGLVKSRVNSQIPFYRTIDAFALVRATGAPALMTRAAWA